MQLINNLSFRNKLILMLLIPSIGLLFFSSREINGKYKEASETKELVVIANLGTTLSSLVHELQKERGSSAGYLGSKGEDFVAKLDNQKKLTDSKIEEVDEYLNSIQKSAFPDAIKEKLNAGLTALQQIEDMRSSVVALEVSSDEAIRFYSEMNSAFINTIASISKISTNSKITEATAAYTGFLFGKEQAGIERAILSRTFGANKFENNDYETFIELVEAQRNYLDMFSIYASKDQLEFCEKILNSDVSIKVDQMREKAIENKNIGGFGIKAGDWFDTMTRKINQLKEVEDKLSQDLDEVSAGVLQSANNTLYYVITITAIFLAITIFLVIMLSKNIINQLGGDPMFVAKVVGEVADGDLTVNLKNIKGTKNTGLLLSVERMVESLLEIVTTVKNSANNINNASLELRTSSEQLSEGANMQASSVEEVSSSMEEMASNIQQNTDNARQTEKMASNASVQLDATNASVEQTISSMTTIVNKTSIISEIARQTNLLALNAAVEAARAGEHGKGFAVVAAEIRKLAERSQNAATEIDELSSNSVQVASKTGDLIKNLVPEIQKTTNLVMEISTASTEQNEGANQINDAIQSLNSVVQENASSAEELSANSQEMSNQASDLLRLMKYFNTGQEDTLGNLVNGNGSLAKSSNGNGSANGKSNGSSNGNGKSTLTKEELKAEGVDINLNSNSEINDNDFENF